MFLPLHLRNASVACRHYVKFDTHSVSCVLSQQKLKCIICVNFHLFQILVKGNHIFSSSSCSSAQSCASLWLLPSPSLVSSFRKRPYSENLAEVATVRGERDQRNQKPLLLRLQIQNQMHWVDTDGENSEGGFGGGFGSGFRGFNSGLGGINRGFGEDFNGRWLMAASYEWFSLIKKN